MGQERSYASSIFISNDNDFFNISTKGTDYYYTNGITIGFINKIKRKNCFDRLMLSPKNSVFTIRKIFIDHKAQTPENITNTAIQWGDYPYAALLTLNYSNFSFFDSYSLASQLTIGVIGPIAGGQEIQTFLHKKVFNSDLPQGWNNQLSNDIAINYKISGTKLLFETNNIETTLHSELNLGTLYNNIMISSSFRIGRFSSYYAPSAWLFDKCNSRTQLFINISPFIKIVQGNSLLEGGPISALTHSRNKTYYIDRKNLQHFLYGYSWSLCYRNRWMAILFAENFYSTEIKGLNGHCFASLGFEFKIN